MEVIQRRAQLYTVHGVIGIGHQTTSLMAFVSSHKYHLEEKN